ncbi:MAG: mandelate racemase/muconate lactonizing enzyme family protein [Parvibaculaceae bacterium]
MSIQQSSGNSGRIAHVEAFSVSIPFTAPEESATLSRRGFDNILLKIETTDGCVGWGEVSGGSGAPVETLRALVDRVSPAVVGRSVFATESIRSSIIADGRLANLRRLAHLVTAGFDMACWDAAGKLAGRPAHQLFGGAMRDTVDFYGYPLGKKPQEVADQASALCRRGFSVIYIKVGMGDGRDLDAVRRVREAVGPEPRIRVDANEAWDLATARRMSIAMEPHRIDFIEQPMDARDIAGMRELRRSTRIPLAANQGIWSLAEALQAIRSETCDVIVTGPYWVGGLLPLQRIGAVCAEAGLGFCLHAPPATSIGTAAGIQALATLPTLLDGNQTYLYYLAEDVSKSLGDPGAARLAVPSGPGLGIDVEEARIREMVRRYEVDGGFLQTGAIGR